MTTDPKTPSVGATTETAKPDDVGTDKASHDGSSDAGGRLPVDVPAGSRLAQLIAERDERLKREELRLPVPTWRNGLVATFRPMTIEERKDFAKKAQARDADEVTNGAAFIAACCIRLELRDNNGDLVPVHDDAGREALMNPAFVNKLKGGENVTSDAGAVQFLVNWNVAAVEGLFEKLYSWSQDTSQEIEGAILGE